MRKFFKILIVPFLVMFLCAGTTFAYIIEDNYIGFDDHGYGDVIGNSSDFDIVEAELTLSGTILTVEIFTAFAGKADDGLFSSYTQGSTGIGYGDLFLTSNWDSGIENTWSHVLSLDDNWSTTGGKAYLYEVEPTNIELSGDYMTGNAIWRDTQEVAYNGNISDSITAGDWNVNLNSISFIVDIAETSLLFGDNIGIHWGMTCANDVIEGAAPVPEPATMLLLGTGLIGIAGIGRKKIIKK